MKADQDYYVYCYFDPRNFEEFYIGKGRGKRSIAHLSDKGESRKTARIKQIEKAGEKPIIRIIASNLSEDQALMVESTLIWRFRRQLTNINSGHFVKEKFRPQNTLHKKEIGFDFSRSIHFFNVGEVGAHRSWEDCRIYNFMSAGYGTRYRRQAQQLQKGDIVLAYLSGCGYVGVGKVVAEAIPARDFRFEDKRLSELDLKAPEIMHDHEDDEKCEYVIGIKWEKSKDRHEGLRKPGLFFARATRVSFGNSENIEQVRTLNCIEAEWNLSFNDLLKED